MDVKESFDELFSIIPEALVRHNQGEFSYGLGNSATNSNTTVTLPRNSLRNLPSPLGRDMADQQVAIAAIK